MRRLAAQGKDGQRPRTARGHDDTTARAQGGAAGACSCHLCRGGRSHPSARPPASRAPAGKVKPPGTEASAAQALLCSWRWAVGREPDSPSQSHVSTCEHAQHGITASQRRAAWQRPSRRMTWLIQGKDKVLSFGRGGCTGHQQPHMRSELCFLFVCLFLISSFFTYIMYFISYIAAIWLSPNNPVWTGAQESNTINPLVLLLL